MRCDRQGLNQHLVEYSSIISNGVSVIVGEVNSLFNVGLPGISDTFGAAAVIGNAANAEVRISNIPLGLTADVAYATYVNGVLSCVTVLNMRAFSSASARTPGSQTRVFSVAGTTSLPARAKILGVAGSNVVLGITCDGNPYDYLLNEGKPVLLSNFTRGMTVPIHNRMVTVQVADSEAVILQL